MANNTIILNGRTYDAVTGKLLEQAVHTTTRTVQQVKQKVIRDIARVPKQASLVHHSKTKPIVKRHIVVHSSAPQAASSIVVTAKPRRHQVAHINHLKAHKPKRAETLMRTAVKKPRPAAKVAARVQLPLTTSQQSSVIQSAIKTSHVHNAALVKRAGTIQPSHLIRHFQVAEQQRLQPQLQSLSVQADPNALLASNDLASVPLRQEEYSLQKTPNSPPKKRQRMLFSNRFASITAALVGVVVIGGFIVVQNIPHIAVRLASVHAGFQVGLPNYQPAGFSFMDHVMASPGKATLQYHSTSDNRSFSITEQTSNWDNQTLRSFVASTGDTVHSWQQGDQTLYMYDNHVTWVGSGIWYQITNHANLSSTQLLSIASSM